MSYYFNKKLFNFNCNFSGCNFNIYWDLKLSANSNNKVYFKNWTKK